MPKKNLKLVTAALAVAAAVLAVVGITPAKHATVTSSFQPAVQASVSPHLTLGNPSGATADESDKDNFLLVKPQYVMSYNNSRGGPNWVSWHLQKSDIGTVERGNFHPDPDLPAGFKHVVPADYTGTGFDRGHICNSKDRTKTVEDNTATFSMANMEPQVPDLNQQVWKKLEDYSRTLAGQGNEMYIVAGCYGGTRTIGRANKVTVPDRCWKVIVVLKQGSNDLSRIDKDTRVIAVDMPNKKGIRRDPWQKYIVTVRDVEDKTGYDFLSEVPKRVQDVLETKRDPGRATPARRPSGRGGNR
jgi:endonuclease G